MADAPKRVYISYGRAPREWVDRLTAWLREHGAEFEFIRLDTELRAGREWEIEGAFGLMDEADAIVLVHTPEGSDDLHYAEVRHAEEVERTDPARVLRFTPDPRADQPEPVAAEILAALAGGMRVDEPLLLSSSVEAAAGRLPNNTVTAAELVTAILSLHGEYGEETGRQIKLPPRQRQAERAPAEEWLRRVRGLYRTDVVDRLHGRFVIRGLALLDPDLTKDLLEYGFLARLEGEMDPPLLAALSPRGRELWDPGDVPTLADRPAREDRLRRGLFALGLAEMIDEERRRSEKDTKGKGQSFLVQLHGPWGSGKSTLLGFLKQDLEEMDSHWIVVEFNAWQQERLEAPWWSLMTAAHRTSRRALAGTNNWWRVIRLLGMELWWRFKVGWAAYLLLPLVLGLLWYALSNDWFDSATAEDGWLAKAADVAKAVGAILSVVVVLYGAVRGLARSFAAGSAKGADTFLKTSQDPMRTLRMRYDRIVTTAGRPIAVFVDDLDRCQPEYVVEVLQGIQTLLIDAPVTYVVAADRRWLYDSYSKVYSDFASVGQDPGRPLGHLFLEKTFQLAASLPAIPPEVRDEYWRGLVVPGDGKDEETGRRLAEEAEQRVEGAGLEEAFQAVDESRGRSTAEEAATRAAASRRLGDEDVRQEVEHRLIPFAHLLEPNPRAMKRLLNAYRIELRRLLAEGRRVGSAAVTPEQLALWTILSMRWPLLADELAAHTECLAPGGSAALGDGFDELWGSDEVQAVVTGDGVRARLTEPAVRALVGAKRRPPPPGLPHEHEPGPVFAGQ